MIVLQKILHLIDSLNEWCGKVFSFLSAALMLIVIYDVFMRYLFTRPTIWGLEMSNYLLAGLTFLGAGYCLLHNGHVKVDIIYAKWPRRLQAAVDVCTYIIVFCFCYVLIKYGGEVALESLREGKLSTSIWAPPLWPSQSLVPIGAFLLGLQALAKWIRDWVVLLTGEDKLRSRVVSGEGGIFAKEE